MPFFCRNGLCEAHALRNLMLVTLQMQRNHDNLIGLADVFKQVFPIMLLSAVFPNISRTFLGRACGCNPIQFRTIITIYYGKCCMLKSLFFASYHFSIKTASLAWLITNREHYTTKHHMKIPVPDWHF